MEQVSVVKTSSCDAFFNKKKHQNSHLRRNSTHTRKTGKEKEGIIVKDIISVSIIAYVNYIKIHLRCISAPYQCRSCQPH